uniref:Alanine dehydrogenase/pyridine nucleotide transhydrogenase N-terminal domain-containing protein n=1 Tax=viral metagenome TaxID=1070528 RepID=A0A6C0HF18_9ZZZZ
MSNLLLYIRKEENPYEYRTPLVPKDIEILIEKGCIIYIESSNERVYTDSEYEAVGAIITNDKWYNIKFKDAFIIGIKQFIELEKLNNHTHIFFSHTFKQQKESKQILGYFSKSNSTLYDLEYFLDINFHRRIAFGYYAGIVGCILGLQQYIEHNLSNLVAWNSYDSMLQSIDQKKLKNTNIKIAVIGANGRCGQGVQKILQHFHLDYTSFTRNSSIDIVNTYDLVFNCIVLDPSYNQVWFSNKSEYRKDCTIVDISCDYASKNNPIAIYNTPTTWENPVFHYNSYINIIAIPNLPSLLPKESSNEFSEDLTKLLLEYEKDTNYTWKNNLHHYFKNIKYI